MKRTAFVAMLLLGGVSAGFSAGAEELNSSQSDSMRQPGVQPYVASPRLSPGDAGRIQQAESYRSSLQGGIQQLERSSSTDPAVRDRLQQLRSELSRVDNSLTDAKRLNR